MGIMRRHEESGGAKKVGAVWEILYTPTRPPDLGCPSSRSRLRMYICTYPTEYLAGILVAAAYVEQVTTPQYPYVSCGD